MQHTASRASAFASYCTRWLPGCACDHGQRYGMYIQERTQERLCLSHTAACFSAFAARQRLRAVRTTTPQGAFPTLTTACCTVPLSVAAIARKHMHALQHVPVVVAHISKRRSTCKNLLTQVTAHSLTKADLACRMPRLRWRPRVPRWHSCIVICTSAGCAMFP